VASGNCLPGVVISQFYGNGGNTGASWVNDYVELHNRTKAAVTLTGWTLQYAGATSTNWSSTPLTGTLAAGGYYLVQLASAGSVGSPLPTAQATGTTNLSASAGKLALVATMTDLVDACPTRADIVDFVGYGSTGTCFRGTGPAPDPSPTLGATRGDSGCAHTGNNDADFANKTATPHNSSSAAKTCTCP
jgi:predicted extracellular nuclease